MCVRYLCINDNDAPSIYKALDQISLLLTADD